MNFTVCELYLNKKVGWLVCFFNVRSCSFESWCHIRQWNQNSTGQMILPHISTSVSNWQVSVFLTHSLYLLLEETAKWSGVEAALLHVHPGAPRHSRGPRVCACVHAPGIHPHCPHSCSTLPHPTPQTYLTAAPHLCYVLPPCCQLSFYISAARALYIRAQIQSLPFYFQWCLFSGVALVTDKFYDLWY